MKIIKVNEMEFYVIKEDKKTMTCLSVKVSGDAPFQESEAQAKALYKKVNKAVSSRLLTLEEAEKLPEEVRTSNDAYWLAESDLAQYRYVTKRGEILDNTDFRYYIGNRPVVIFTK